MTGPNVTAAVIAKPTQTELEMEAGRKAVERRTAQLAVPPKKTNGPATVIPFPLGETVNTGIVAAATAKQAQAEQQSEQQPGPNASQAKQSGMSPPLGFLDNFFGADKRHLVAIKKYKGKTPDIEARHFEAPDLAGQQKFITDHSDAGFDIYFSPNPIRGTLNKKGKKGDVVEARHLWIDLDPRSGEPLADERAAMLALLTTNLPKGMPRPNRVIDSGRGYWGWWKLDKPMPVDGNGELTAAVESYGRGIEQAFGDRFADGCKNIDRVARLPGTINTKTGNIARVLHDFSHDEPHVIESFPRSATKPKPPGNVMPFKLPESFTNARPAAAFADLPDDSLAAGLETDLEEIRSAALAIPPLVIAAEPAWMKVARALANEARRYPKRADKLWEILDEISRRAPGYDKENNQSRWLRYINEALNRENPITIATVFALAKEHGWQGWSPAAAVTSGAEKAIDSDLAEMNDRHFVTQLGGKTRVVTEGEDDEFKGRQTIVAVSSFEDFTNLHSNRRKSWTEIGKNGGEPKPVEIPLGAWWLRQKKRRQYDNGMKFMPHSDAEVVNGRRNLWRGFGVADRKPDGKSGEAGCKLFLDHMRTILCSGNEEHFDYFRKHHATIIQERRRTEIAVGLHTEEEGSGKGFHFNHFGHLLGSHFMQVSNPDHVCGKFNPHFETLLLLFADEAVFAKDPRHRNALYGLITEPRLTIEPKFYSAYPARSYINVGIASNAPHFLPVGPNARRFFIPTVSPDRAGDLAYFNAIEAQLLDGGYEALLYHLLHEVDLKDFDVRNVPRTDGLREQAGYSRKGVDSLVEQVCNDARVPCEIDGAPGCSRTGDVTTLGTLDHLLAHQAERELQKPLTVKRRLCASIEKGGWGCTSGDAAKLWNGDRYIACIQWPTLAEVRKLFEQRYGPQVWDAADVTEWTLNLTEIHRGIGYRIDGTRPDDDESLPGKRRLADVSPVRVPPAIPQAAIDQAATALALGRKATGR
jgi:hypothetical protein